MSLDSIPDSVALSDIELLRQKYRLDEKSVEAVQLILKQIPIGDLSSIITDDFFMRKLIPLIEEGTDIIKLRALELLMKWLQTNKKSKHRKVSLGL